MTTKINESFLEWKKGFLTGHTGFKGSWLSIWLTELGAEVKGFALKPKKSNNLFDIANVSNYLESDINDINDYDALSESINIFKPEVVIHMAAQPLVIESYAEPINTYKTNVIGTANILEASRHCNSIKAILILLQISAMKILSMIMHIKKMIKWVVMIHIAVAKVVLN